MNFSATREKDVPEKPGSKRVWAVLRDELLTSSSVLNLPEASSGDRGQRAQNLLQSPCGPGLLQECYIWDIRGLSWKKQSLWEFGQGFGGGSHSCQKARVVARKTEMAGVDSSPAVLGSAGPAKMFPRKYNVKLSSCFLDSKVFSPRHELL